MATTELARRERLTERERTNLDRQREILRDVELWHKRTAWCVRISCLSVALTLVATVGLGGWFLLFLLIPIASLIFTFCSKQALRQDVIVLRRNVNKALTQYVDALTAEEEERARVLVGNPTVVHSTQRPTGFNDHPDRCTCPVCIFLHSFERNYTRGKRHEQPPTQQKR